MGIDYRQLRALVPMRDVLELLGCGAGGNALDLYAAVTRQPLYQAAVELCRRLGCTVPWLQCDRPRPRENNTMSYP